MRAASSRGCRRSGLTTALPAAIADPQPDASKPAAVTQVAGHRQGDPDHVAAGSSAGRAGVRAGRDHRPGRAAGSRWSARHGAAESGQGRVTSLGHARRRRARGWRSGGRRSAPGRTSRAARNRRSPAPSRTRPRRRQAGEGAGVDVELDRQAAVGRQAVAGLRNSAAVGQRPERLEAALRRSRTPPRRAPGRSRP